MFQLDPSTDFSFLIGATLIQLRLGQNEAILCFEPPATVTIEGDFLAGKQEVGLYTRILAGAPALIELIGSTVASYGVGPDSSLTLRFDEGSQVTALNSSDFYECFQVEVAGKIWVV